MKLKGRLCALLLGIVLLVGCGGVTQQQYDDLAGQNQLLEEQVRQLEQERQENHTALEDLTAQQELWAKQAETQAEQLAALSGRLEELEGDYAAAQAQVKELEGQLADLQQQNAALQAAGNSGGGDTGGTAAGTVQADEPQEQASAGSLVWIPKTGSKYHSRSSCSNMKNPSQASEEDAIAWGYGRCSKCW